MILKLFPGLILKKLLHNTVKPKFNYSTYDLDLKIDDLNLNKYINKLQNDYKQIIETNSFVSNIKLQRLKPIINLLHEREEIVDNIRILQPLLNEQDGDIRILAEEEKKEFEAKIIALDLSLQESLLPEEQEDSFNNIIMEINAGVGGQEAMLFASELYEMYCGFVNYKGWGYEIADYVTTDIGGIRFASLLIEGNKSYEVLKHEAGVHRVQRIPATEKSGRVHTSTVSLVILPQPSEIEVNIDNKDLRIETKRASGAGGQHVNTTNSAVRITHIPTGISVDCQTDRSQIKNRKIAMQKLRAKLYEQSMNSQVAQVEATRKSQVRSNFRNEKVRTFNFSQDRVTDHRLTDGTTHNIKGFLTGGEALDLLIKKLDRNFKIEHLRSIVNNL